MKNFKSIYTFKIKCIKTYLGQAWNFTLYLVLSPKRQFFCFGKIFWDFLRYTFACLIPLSQCGCMYEIVARFISSLQIFGVHFGWQSYQNTKMLRNFSSCLSSLAKCKNGTNGNENHATYFWYFGSFDEKTNLPKWHEININRENSGCWIFCFCKP